jgi:hypothetical protein
VSFTLPALMNTTDFFLIYFAGDFRGGTAFTSGRKKFVRR